VETILTNSNAATPLTKEAETVKAEGVASTEDVPASYEVLPFSPWCEPIIRNANHALVGLSPFNNYYSHRRICSIITWAQRTFRSFSVLLPGEEAALTLIAAGEPAHTAATKARLHVSKLRSRALDAMSRVGIKNGQSSVFTLAQFNEHDVYKQLRRKVRDCYLSDAHFRALCLEAAQAVVAKRLSNRSEPTPVQMEIAVEYLMAEIPLLLDTPAILHVETSVFVYHRIAPLFKEIFHRGLSISPSPAQAGAALIAEPWNEGDEL